MMNLLFETNITLKNKPHDVPHVWGMSPEERLSSVRSVYGVCLVLIDGSQCSCLGIKMSLE